MSNAYLTSNTMIAYPFADDASGLSRDGGSGIPLDFLADAAGMLGAGDGTLCLSSISRSGDDFEFTFKDLTGTTIITNVKALASLPAAFGLVVFETDTGDPTTSSVLRIVTGPSFVDTLSAMPVGITPFGITLPFSQGTIEPRPPRVTAIRVGTHDITDTVLLHEGYNCALSNNVDPLSIAGAHASRIMIQLEPGLGLGQYDPCEDPEPVEYIARINSIAPDSQGNLAINPGDCHLLPADPDNARMFISNICQACCLCDDYANVVTYLSGALSELSNEDEESPGILQKIDGAIDTMNSEILAYNVRIKERKAFTVSLSGMIGYDGACVANPTKPPTICMVIIRITNGYSEDKGPVKITALDILPTDDEYAEFSATACWISWRAGAGWNSRRDVAFYQEMVDGTAEIASIPSGSTAVITCRLKVSSGIASGTGAVEVEVDGDTYEASGEWQGDP